MELINTTTECLIIVAFAFYTYWLWQRRHVYKFAWNYPFSVAGIPPLGAFIYIGTIRNLLPFLQKFWQRCEESTAVIWLSLTPFIFTSDPNVVEQILVQPEFLEKSTTIYEPVRDVLKGGMIALQSEEAQRLRKIFAPALRHKKLLGLMPIFNEKSNLFLAQVHRLYKAGGEAHDLLHALHVFTLGVSRRTTMGHNKDGDAKDMPNVMKRLLFAFRHTLFAVILNCANLRYLIYYNPFFVYTRKKLYDFANEIITFRAKSGVNNEDLGSIGVNEKEPFLFIDQAFKFYKSGDLTWMAVVGESNGLLVATYETTSIGLYSTLILLAMHPKIQERLFEEILSVYPSNEIYVSYEHLKDLPYLEMVINEALRLFPPAPLIGREVIEESVLKVNGRVHKLPKDMQLLIDIFQLQRNKSIWGADADKFNPDNFLPQNVAARTPYAFIPFSKGPRNCMGWAYAYILMKVLLIHVLRNYQVSTEFKLEDIRVTMNVFLEYNTEPPIKLHQRKCSTSS